MFGLYVCVWSNIDTFDFIIQINKALRLVPPSQECRINQDLVQSIKIQLEEPKPATLNNKVRCIKSSHFHQWLKRVVSKCITDDDIWFLLHLFIAYENISKFQCSGTVVLRHLINCKSSISGNFSARTCTRSMLDFKMKHGSQTRSLRSWCRHMNILYTYHYSV